jgi:SSS family solute:Na+ symporter
MHPIDVAVIAVYVVGCTILGARIGGAAGGKGLKGYFLGERNIPAWAVMISIVATETSAATFLSVPGSGYRGDLTLLQLAFGYILARIVVAVLLLPAYFKGEIYTAYQVLERRFGGATQKAASILFLISRTLGSGLRLFLAAKVLEEITGLDLRISIVLIGASTVLYTFLGGLKGVVWTDVLQFSIYLIAAGFALIILLRTVPGGWPAIWEQGWAAGKFRVINLGTSGLASPHDLGGWLSFLKAVLSQPYTIWAGLIGGLVLDTGTHGADQMMVQRYLSARSQRQASWALIASGFVILVQFALFLVIGVGLWVLYHGEPIVKDREFARFIKSYLPTGLLGLVIAAILSVTMSTVSGAMSASASSTINDLYRPLFPATDERRLLRLSQVFTAIWGVAQMGVALGAIALQDSVIDNALAIASFVMGILLGLFLLGLLTRHVGERAAFVGMIAGIALVSAVKFGTTIAYPWYALVGSSTVFLVAVVVNPLFPSAKPESLSRAETS